MRIIWLMDGSLVWDLPTTSFWHSDAVGGPSTPTGRQMWPWVPDISLTRNSGMTASTASTSERKLLLPAPGTGQIAASFSGLALMLQVGGNLAAVLGQLEHDLLVEPDVHRRGIFGVAGVLQLSGQLLARRQAAVQFE